nr:Eco57I restriction-modification methylase domain-containing protein [uncultured Ruminococcus sp.]
MNNEHFFNNVYNPDVLTCLANLSNDEVFTPPDIANQMLDMLPEDLFTNPNTTFLDPGCKSGVFLREIAKRLLIGLEPIIPDLQERIDHIFQKQLYGIALTELTSLLSRRSTYCSKFPDSEFSVTKFDNPQGNIRFKKIQHAWKDGKCVYCGATQEKYDRSDGLEFYAYEFIHTLKPEEIFNMKFDVIIGNPPYQLTTGETTVSGAIPIYNKFIEQAKKLKPRYLSMIIPSRWFAGGLGLSEFRKTMLSDKSISHIVDFPNSKECFPGVSVAGGVCYFLRDANYNGDCLFTTVRDGKENSSMRKLDEFDTFVRYNEAVGIINKILSYNEELFINLISSRNPFNLSTKERGIESKKTGYLRLLSSRGYGFVDKNDISNGMEYIDMYQVAISRATSEHAGEPGKDGKFKVIPKMRILNPGDICTASYFLLGNSDNIEKIKNIKQYVETRFVRFLVLQAISSINLSKDSFKFVPMQDFSKSLTDEELYAKYELTQEEIDFIESMIKPMELDGDK